jgi:hypothetical protein
LCFFSTSMNSLFSPVSFFLTEFKNRLDQILLTLSHDEMHTPVIFSHCNTVHVSSAM